MMVSNLSLLRKYARAFRDLINSRVQGSDGAIKQLLKLNADSDWEFLTAAMDIVDDASAALSHVQRFGLSGPTKYNDLGETYLRLYGLLSAAYIQQQAILTLYKIMHVPDPKERRKLFDQLVLRSLRHKLSAHGTDYKSDREAKGEAFVPLQFDLGDQNVTSVNYTQSSHHERVDITTAIDAHVTLMIETLDMILDKAIATVFKQAPTRQAEHRAKLADLRIEKAGGMIIGPPGEARLVITIVGSNEAQ